TQACHALKSSLRGANGSRKRVPDDRLRDEAIPFFAVPWIASLSLAMTTGADEQGHGRQQQRHS
ncbi:MAG: hypothetical protein WB420_03660, partial [Bradyrhizobium sp.]